MKKKENLAYFVHIPKTAGNTIRSILRTENVLINPGYKKIERVHHFGKRNVERIVDSQLSFDSPYFPSYIDDLNFSKALIKFTCVRNPFDLLSSYYHHYIDSTKQKNWIDRGWANVNGFHGVNSFFQFIDYYCNCEPEEWHVPELNKNLFGQIFNSEGKSNLDYVIFLENIDAGLHDIFNIIKSNESFNHQCSSKFFYLLRRLRRDFISNTHKNKSIKKEFYNDVMIKMVENKCCWELDTFQYSVNKHSRKNTIQSVLQLSL